MKAILARSLVLDVSSAMERDARYYYAVGRGRTAIVRYVVPAQRYTSVEIKDLFMDAFLEVLSALYGRDFASTSQILVGMLMHLKRSSGIALLMFMFMIKYMGDMGGGVGGVYCTHPCGLLKLP